MKRHVHLNVGPRQDHPELMCEKWVDGWQNNTGLPGSYAITEDVNETTCPDCLQRLTTVLSMQEQLEMSRDDEPRFEEGDVIKVTRDVYRKKRGLGIYVGHGEWVREHETIEKSYHYGISEIIETTYESHKHTMLRCYRLRWDKVERCWVGHGERKIISLTDGKPVIWKRIENLGKVW